MGASGSSSNPSVFNDDEPINESQIKLGQNLNSDWYDLDKILTLEVKSLHKSFQFSKDKIQTIPVMVSLSTKNEQIANTASPGRAFLDLVCVIDTSGSMEGEKLKSVQKTLGYLLDLLNENDRVSIVEFNDNSKKLCGLTRVSAKSKSIIKKAISSLEAIGGTNIESGMQTAFKILKERRQKNIVTSVFLLSDGQDKGAELRVKDSLEQLVKEQCFTIHSFGFGSDHDGPQMKAICKQKEGNFYFVERVNQVDEFFVDALGGLFSVIGQEVVLDVNISENCTLMGNITVGKTYGEMWREEKKNSAYKIKISQLMSGISKDFIFELEIPPKEVLDLKDSDRNIEIVTARVSANPVSDVHSSNVRKQSSLTLTLVKSNEQIEQQSQKANDAVQYNYLRVKAAETMQQAINKAEKKQYYEGEQLISSMIEKLSSFSLGSSFSANKEMEVLRNDLMDCKKNTRKDEYVRNGRHNMQRKVNANYYQESQAVEEEDIFQNRCQMEMVKKLKKSKF